MWTIPIERRARPRDMAVLNSGLPKPVDKVQRNHARTCIIRYTLTKSASSNDVYKYSAIIIMGVRLYNTMHAWINTYIHTYIHTYILNTSPLTSLHCAGLLWKAKPNKNSNGDAPARATFRGDIRVMENYMCRWINKWTAYVNVRYADKESRTHKYTDTCIHAIRKHMRTYFILVQAHMHTLHTQIPDRSINRRNYIHLYV